MELQLHDTVPAPYVNGNLSINQLSWWFWIKAGMGLTVGVGIVTITAFLFWALFWVNIFLGLTRPSIR